MADSPAPAVYRVAEVAALLRIGRRQTYEAIVRGEIPCKKIGASVRCSKVQIHIWLDGETARGEGGEDDARSTQGRQSVEVTG